ncbi:ExeA family protein [Syntrophobacter fumaroxidans]|uniref:AAA ATPase n=1 Tax=Syntrophobacter fumaroxidans (strain DSM 10017 / MPOB) TaxID=335543 RepID=A0LH23_SYNFM|nr:AAA family ATPase [Syntrophobacter fumaroxidans]ABK16725.1 AAA ATPase [Syntrophobacter fumaroxidans MPOB]
MYMEFYGFAEMPFGLGPDPKFLYFAPSHFEAYSSMMAGIREQKGVIVITGEVGTGKTLLIRTLLNDLADDIKTVFVFHTGLSLKDLLKQVLLQLDVPLWEKEENLAYYLRTLGGYLNERLARNETVAVIIDEAQNLDEDTLEGLGRLCDPETPVGKVLQILLVGHPELEEKLGGDKLRAFRLKIKVHRRIAPLNREEGRRYVEHRLKVAGGKENGTFTPKAVDRILEFARGIPRVINLICDRALLIGFSRASPSIDLKIAREAIREMDYLRPAGSGPLLRTPSLRKPGHNMVRVFLLLLSLVIFAFSLQKLLAVLLRQ